MAQRRHCHPCSPADHAERLHGPGRRRACGGARDLGSAAYGGRGSPPAPGRGDLASPTHYLTAVGVYLERALVPLPLTVSHPYAPWPAAGLAAVAALLVASVLAARRCRDLATPIALFLAPLGPVSMAAAGMGSTAERYFYLPSLGLAWLVAALLSRAALAQLRPLRALPAVSAVLIVLGTCSAFLRLADWRQPPPPVRGGGGGRSTIGRRTSASAGRR